MKFSIIVPVFNTEQYLEECISSVLQQTYPLYELILVDDGSTDSSGAICDRYMHMYPDKILVSHRINQGQFHSRIHGIQIAKGDIICFLDSDDTLRTDTLEILANTFETHQCDLVLYEASKSEAFPSRPITIGLTPETVFSEKSKRSIYQRAIETQELNSLCLKAVRKEYAKIPNRFITLENLKHGEDLLLSAEYLTAAPRIVHIKEGLYHYRTRPESITHIPSPNYFRSIKTVHQELDKYISLWNMPELALPHNSRKVKGCVDECISLINNRKVTSPKEFIGKLKALLNDPYFTNAYCNMDSSQLRASHRIIAACMYHKNYVLLYAVVTLKNLLLKRKRHRVRCKNV